MDRVRAALTRGVVGCARIRRRLDPGRGAVALTFDDGPDPRHTPALLDELARLGVVATFFLVGDKAAAHPGLVRRMLAEGHAVGSHSSSHPEPWRLSAGALVGEYRRGRAQVEGAAGRPVALFRPPKGYVSGGGALAMVAARVRPWLWTVDPEDWVPEVAPGAIVGALEGLADGDVVLLHDAIEGPLAPSALDRSATVGALDGVVAQARARGLGFVTLDDDGRPPASPGG